MSKIASRIVTLNKTVLSFPKLFKPEAYAEGEPRFSATFLFDPGSEAAKVAQQAIDEIIAEQWAGKRPNALKVCVQEGDAKVAAARNPENYSMYEGKLYVTASAKQDRPPIVVDTDGATPLTAASGKVYGGAIAGAIIRLWGQDNKWGVRINAELRAVQVQGAGTPFGSGGRIDTSRYFQAVDEEDWAA